MGIFDLLGALFSALWPIFALLIVGSLTVRVVHQKTVCVVETFGRYSRTLHPGINFIIPVVQKVVYRIELSVQEIKDTVVVKTVDETFANVPVAIMVRVIESHAHHAYYELDDPMEQVKTWVLNAVRPSLAKFKLKDLFEDREKLQEEVQKQVRNKMREYGFEVVDILIEPPIVSDELQAASTRVVASQREKEAATHEAEATRIKMVGQARAEAEAQEERAKGLAAARKILVESLTEVVGSAKTHGIDEQAVMTLLIETNRLDTIKDASKHGKLVVMDSRPGLNVNID